MLWRMSCGKIVTARSGVMLRSGWTLSVSLEAGRPYSAKVIEWMSKRRTPAASIGSWTESSARRNGEVRRRFEVEARGASHETAVSGG